jgi:hypothetical protein
LEDFFITREQAHKYTVPFRSICTALWCVTSNMKWSFCMRACNLCDLWKFCIKLPRRAAQSEFLVLNWWEPFVLSPCDPVTYKIFCRFLCLWPVTIQIEWNGTVSQCCLDQRFDRVGFLKHAQNGILGCSTPLWTVNQLMPRADHCNWEGGSGIWSQCCVAINFELQILGCALAVK